MDYVVVTDGLSKRYGTRMGIEGIDLRVARGQIFGFLGPNGSGKTTTIRTLLGFIRPTRGSAQAFGLDCWRDSHRIKERVGYLSGDLRLYPWMTLKNGLDLVGKMRRSNVLTQGMELAERFALEARVPVRKMSRGMRQKLGLILTLAPNPNLLVLDEPSSGLDPGMQDLLYAILRERAARGDTTFFSSHTLSEVDQLCDHVAILRAGKVVANESLESLRARTARIVTLRWRGEAPKDIALPKGLRIAERDGTRWRGTLTGSSMEAIRWAADQALDDFTVTPPDLETLFRQFYDDESESS